MTIIDTIIDNNSSTNFGKHCWDNNKENKIFQTKSHDDDSDSKHDYECLHLMPIIVALTETITLLTTSLISTNDHDICGYKNVLGTKN